MQLAQQHQVEIVKLCQEGYTVAHLAKLYKVSKQSVYNLLRKFDTTGMVRDQERTGWPCATTGREDCIIKRLATRTPGISCQLIANNFNSMTNKNITARTVNNCLQHMGLVNRMRQHKPLLLHWNRQQQLAWACKKQQWTTDNWKNVFFTDETKLLVVGGYVNQKCWVCNGTKAPNVATLQGGGGCIMVWAAFSCERVLPLEWIEGTLNSTRYIALLERAMLPHYCCHRVPRILQQDNAPAHCAGATSTWFSNWRIEVLDWPTQSPDLNPIENLFSIFKYKLAVKK